MEGREDGEGFGKKADKTRKEKEARKETGITKKR